MTATELDVVKVLGSQDCGFSGKQGADFLDNHLAPALRLARDNGTKLIVTMDGAYGYSTAFLEAAFGGLTREFSVAELQETLVPCCADEPYLMDEVRRHIRLAWKSTVELGSDE